jgi:energy-converting hydrogenase B subunit D
VIALQIMALAVVAVGGTAVVLASGPWRQTLVLGIYGLALSMLFFVVQAPDVALSEIVVSTVGLPVMILLALRKVRQQQEEHREEEEDG